SERSPSMTMGPGDARHWKRRRDRGLVGGGRRHDPQPGQDQRGKPRHGFRSYKTPPSALGFCKYMSLESSEHVAQAASGAGFTPAKRAQNEKGRGLAAAPRVRLLGCCALVLGDCRALRDEDHLDP